MSAVKTSLVFIKFTLSRPKRERQHARSKISDGNEEDSSSTVAICDCRCSADCLLDANRGGERARMRFRGKLHDVRVASSIRVDAIWRIFVLS